MLNTRTRLFFAFLKYAALVPLAPSNRTIGSGSPRLRPTKQLAPVPTGSDQPNNWLWFPLAPTNQTIGSGSPRLQPTKQLAPAPTGSDQPNNWLRFPPAPTNQTIGTGFEVAQKIGSGTSFGSTVLVPLPSQGLKQRRWLIITPYDIPFPGEMVTRKNDASPALIIYVSFYQMIL